jgi:hypothetical protein
VSGSVEAIFLSPAATQLPRQVARARAMTGLGLEGDRYAEGVGTFSDGTPEGRALTLVEAEALEDLDLDGAAARRNVVTRGIRLNPLVGKRFAVGDVVCEGSRLCEPCAHLDRLAGPGLLSSMAGRGGLRANILEGGELAVGAPVRLVQVLRDP